MTYSMSPLPGSHSALLCLKHGDLITPDGYRVWVVDHWTDNGMVGCSTTYDHWEGDYPSKQIPDDPNSLAPLNHVNRHSLQQEFMADYHRQFRHQKPLRPLCIDGDSLDAWQERVDAKAGIRPYAATHTEHVLYEVDYHLRVVQVEDGRGVLSDYDAWEIWASWHIAPAPDPKRPAVVPEPSKTQGQFLYRFYNRAGVLLYVGITDNPLRRWKEHSKSKPWWPEVSQLTQDWYPDRASVEAAERHFIVNEHPKYNIVHNDRVVLR
ncbi:GIY-YIG endonuclease [Gordonia phage Holliday]|nr:GIY-YIG endonuclease [Gordonia phage Holliday]